MKIVKPTLILNKERVLKNIKIMAEKAVKNNVLFRPHFKTHQSAEIGEWFKEEGVTAITVSSVDMAQYFADNGWTDITIAFPVNIRQIETINELAKKITLNLLVESIDTMEYLNQNLQAKVNIWIKVDTGYHRSGIDWDNEAELSHLIRDIKKTQNMHFIGLLTHSGHSYKAHSVSEIKEIYEDTVVKLKNIQERLFLQGFSIVKLSIGDTPTCSVVDDFTGVDEIRPGNFVFYDLIQLKLGTCNEEDIGVAVACPVVSKHPEREELIIYGGAIHLSKETIKREEINLSYGAIAFPEGETWGRINHELYVKSLSQEHGVVHCPRNYFADIKIGDLLYVIPVHSCLTANLMKKIFMSDGTEIDMMMNY
ncbi:MAG: alanine racemase [Asgard group archaeon]|nr:alanine racemase [Asgard group archaeon]